MPQQRLQPVMLEEHRIVFRNFTGNEGRFNAQGDRNFCVLLDPEEAEAMAKDGWNVKALKPREEGDSEQPFLKVKIKYGTKGQPPRVILITGRGKTPLDESMIDILDWAEIENVDMIVRPWDREVDGKRMVSAYLKSMYVTIREDELEKKYYDVPDSAASSIVEHDDNQSPPWEE